MSSKPGQRFWLVAARIRLFNGTCCTDLARGHPCIELHTAVCGFDMKFNIRIEIHCVGEHVLFVIAVIYYDSSVFIIHHIITYGTYLHQHPISSLIAIAMFDNTATTVAPIATIVTNVLATHE